MLHLHLVLDRATIFNMATDVRAGVQVVAEVMGYGLVDILVTAIASAALGPWRAIVMA